MENKNLAELAKKIFASVESDLKDRRGIGNEWEGCDDEIQQEIRETNEEKILAILKGAL